MRLQRRRPVDPQIGHLAGADVPALQHQARVVHAMVVVQVGEQRVRDVGRREAALDQPLMRAGPVVQHDRLVADLDEIAGALPLAWTAPASRSPAVSASCMRLVPSPVANSMA